MSDLFDILHTTRAMRRLKPDPVPDALIRKILEAGIAAASADLLLMLDDDNILDPDYLQAAVEIAAENPTLGAFGGISRPVLETGQPKP